MATITTKKRNKIKQRKNLSISQEHTDLLSKPSKLNRELRICCDSYKTCEGPCHGPGARLVSHQISTSKITPEYRWAAHRSLLRASEKLRVRSCPELARRSAICSMVTKPPAYLRRRANVLTKKLVWQVSTTSKKRHSLVAETHWVVLTYHILQVLPWFKINSGHILYSFFLKFRTNTFLLYYNGISGTCNSVSIKSVPNGLSLSTN